MTRFNNLFNQTQDDAPIVIPRQDFSGGANTRVHPINLPEKQAEQLVNIDISIPGQVTKRRGIDLVEDLGNDAGTGALGFDPDGGSNVLVVTHGTKLETWTGAGVFTERKTNFTTGLQTAIIKGGESGEGDVFFVASDVFVKK